MNIATASKKLLPFLLFAVIATSHAQQGKREYYELSVYHFSGEAAAARLDKYFGEALVPALHRAGVKQVGVFRSSAADTSSDRKFVVLVPVSSVNDLENLSAKLDKDKKYQESAADVIGAAHDNVAYTRMEKMILKAFTGMPKLAKPALQGNKQDRIYELRSYEGPTEQLYRTKVKMFNEGDEVGIFKRLGFNAVFYSETLVGSKMPNLVYMVSFDNKQSRDDHWKAFSGDAEWNKLKADKQYDNTVSHIDANYFYPADYSDL